MNLVGELKRRIGMTFMSYACGEPCFDGYAAWSPNPEKNKFNLDGFALNCSRVDHLRRLKE